MAADAVKEGRLRLSARHFLNCLSHLTCELIASEAERLSHKHAGPAMPFVGSLEQTRAATGQSAHSAG